ncbi:MAG: DUF1292 domain-containing protein [Lachnospiraceae bacterium]|nr:DUF1292 domain-containing protein [Lachnospiraceae bacterium]
MEKLIFKPADGDTPEEFAVIAQTQMRGCSYLLVTPADTEDEEDGEAYILRDDSAAEDAEALYTTVEDDAELAAVWEVFRQLLDDEEITLEETDL